MEITPEPEPEIFVPSWATARFEEPVLEPEEEQIAAIPQNWGEEPTTHWASQAVEEEFAEPIAYAESSPEDDDPTDLAGMAPAGVPQPSSGTGVPASQLLALLDFQSAIHSPELSHREAADMALSEMVRLHLSRPLDTPAGLEQAEPVAFGALPIEIEPHPPVWEAPVEADWNTAFEVSAPASASGTAFVVNGPPRGDAMKTLGLPAPREKRQSQRARNIGTEEVVASIPARFPEITAQQVLPLQPFTLATADSLIQLAVTIEPRCADRQIAADVEAEAFSASKLPYLNFRLNFGATEPSVAGKVDVPEGTAIAARAKLRAPVSFQAFAMQGSVELPAAAGEPAVPYPALVQTMLAWNAAEKIRMHAGSRGPLGLMPPFPATGETLRPRCHFDIAAPSHKIDFNQVMEEVREMASNTPRRMIATVGDFWQNAPRDLKMLLFAVPLALALAFHPSLPKVSLKAPQTAASSKGFREVLDTQWGNVRQTIAKRAAIGLDENFRQGLDNWVGNSGSTAEWSFDQAGFVMPARVALYQPSLGLSDYEFQFLGAVDRGALSWVVRAADFQNYYVVKLVTLRPGPVPQMGIVRYAVINGKAMDREDTPVAMQLRADSLYRVSMDIQGDHYALQIQGQMIDSWSEPRLKHGGVGFYTNRGEQSRIGWVQITHQYDMLGRLFAYLAP